MKKIINILFAASALLLAGCTKSILPVGYGALSLNLSCNDEYVDVSTKAGGAGVDVGEFLVSVERVIDGWTAVEPVRFADIPESLPLPAGEYILNVVSPEAEEAAFDQPIYGGHRKFTIVAGQVESVKVVCSLQNVKVTLAPTERFLAELDMYEVKISNNIDPTKNVLVWDTDAVKDGTKAGYFTVAPLYVYVKARRHSDDKDISMPAKMFSDVAARDHLTIVLDAKETGSLSGDITITIDDRTNDKTDNVVVDGFDEIPVPGPGEGDDDEPETPKYISLEWQANPNFNRSELKEEMDVNLLLKVEYGIESFLVKIASPTAGFMETVGILATRGYDAEGNQIDPKAQIPAIAELDLTDEKTYLGTGGVSMQTVLGLDPDDYPTLIGATELSFALSDLVPMVLNFSPKGGTVHVFSMEITDKEGNTFSRDLEFECRGN